MGNVSRQHAFNGADDCTLEASQQALVFNTGGANERYGIAHFVSLQWFIIKAAGLRSMVLGDFTTASGENSFSGGSGSQVTVNQSFSFGHNNQSTNFGVVTMGNNNLASGENTIVFRIKD